MPKNFKVDDTLFRARAKRLVRELKIDEPIFVREQAGLLAQLLAKLTPPFKSFPKMSGKPSYTTGGAQGQGAKAVRAGFFQAVQRVGSANSWNDKRIRKAIRAGDTAELTRLFAHMKNSNKRGLKVLPYSDAKRNQQRDFRGRVHPSTQPFIGVSTKDVNAGLKRALNNVGIAKASFALAALRLGRPGAPKWIARHFGKLNSPVRITQNPARASFSATAAGLDAVARRLKSAERFRMNAMIKRLEALVRSNAKQSGFKTR